MQFKLQGCVYTLYVCVCMYNVTHLVVCVHCRCMWNIDSVNWRICAIGKLWNLSCKFEERVANRSEDRQIN